jgi:hypothetical protein
VFISKDHPCLFCREHDFTQCFKDWGPKAKAVINKRISNATNPVIPQEERMLLQFAYSEDFESVCFGGPLLANLLRKFIPVFGLTIDSDSLRQAILAWGIAFKVSELNYGAIQQCRDASVATISAKLSKHTTDESDLFATFLLSMLSSAYQNFAEYVLHVQGFRVVMSQLCQRPEMEKHLFKFWPLAIDLILEGSRRFLRGRDEVVKLCNCCRQLLGPQRFIRRKDYLEEIYGSNPKTVDYAFSQAIWHYSVILRVCFRKTLHRQWKGAQGMSENIEATVSELKVDLNSSEFREIVNGLTELMWRNDLNPNLDPTVDLMLFSLLVYHFCQHLIALLQSAAIVNAINTFNAVSYAKLLIELTHAHPEWLTPATSQEHFPLALAKHIVPRILWIAGLSLNTKNEPEGTSISNVFEHIC